jgi:Ca-activated chloride channel homolog
MGKLPFLFLSLFLAVNSMTVFAQSRPKIDETVQKVNKRPPQTAPTPLPTATPPDENTTNIPSVTTSANIEGIKPGEEILTVDTNLVTIPVKISDRNGRLISGLKKADFKIFENNLEQEIAYFSNEEQPFTVALVLDMSYSTTFKINEIHSAASAFIAQLRPNDKVMIVSFDEEVHLLCEPTNDRDQLLRAIRSTKIATGTSLYEAVDIVINEKLKKIAGRKAIVLFTDGVDTTSRRVSSFNNESDASELDALIYPIQYDTYNDVQQMKNKPVVMKPPTTSPIPSSTPSSPFPFPIPTSGVGTPSSQGTTAEEYRKAGEYLEDMANRTGGRIYQATTTSNLATAFSNIANELREFYSLGYYPPTEGKVGERRKIKVKINQTNLAVRSRDSYIVGKKSK